MIDESIFEPFYERTKKALWLYVCRSAGDPSLADDILQEAYIRLLRSGVDALNEAKLKSYLYTIATNLMNDHYRKRKRDRNLFDESGRGSSGRSPELAGEFRHDIGNAFGQLNAQQRALLWLAYVEEYKHHEIGVVLQLREKSVKVLLFRAKQKLAQIFKQMNITSRNMI